MARYSKLGKPTDQRKALLRNQVSALLMNGKIKTTQARAKDVCRLAEKMISLAIKNHDKVIKLSKQVNNEKGQTVTIEVTNDLPSKLNARRMIMSYVYDIKAPREKNETKKEYADRHRKIKHPLIEKIFNEYGAKYDARNQKENCGGGYTRIIKLGPRRGDAAEEVIVELV